MSSRPQHKDRKYKDLSMKQKTRIAEKTYSKYLRFFLENSRMPDVNEAVSIHKKLFESVRSLAPLADFESFDVLCNKRAETYEARIQKEISQGMTLEKLDSAKRKKTPEEKAEVQKKKQELRRKKKKRKAEHTIDTPEQDDRFFFIAGYTSGGAPYGVTWEEMGLEPWENLE